MGLDVSENSHDSELRRQFAAAKGSWHWLSNAEWARALELASGSWAEKLHGVQFPWLCWNVDSQWCLVQQRMVTAVGWTPVVGFDPRAGEPPLVEGAILVDFNRGLDFPSMSMMFPLELTFLFAPRLAFWHSDLLVRKPLFVDLASSFRTLKPGLTAAVDLRARWYRRLLGEKRGRYWELIGCTTREASRAQFETGCGWWRHTSAHVNCPNESERQARSRYTHDHGSGILIWEERHGGLVQPISAKPLDEGHCTRIGNKRYQPQSPTDHRRDLSKDLSHNYDLKEVCAALGLAEFLSP